jgi:hypothetical protein
MAVSNQLTTYSIATTYNYTIPNWASHIYVAVIGGGGAGGSSVFGLWGGGGSAGAFGAKVLYRGQSYTGQYTLPLTVTTLSVTVGAAGVGAATSSATNGGDSTISAAGEGTLVTGTGGARGTWNNNGPAGTGTTGYTFLGTSVPAPRDVTLVLPSAIAGIAGNAIAANAALGSAGSGGGSIISGIGSNGRQGGAWILAYGDRPAFSTMF